jgi:4-amino-4-deoxy-L-arabinose transferase-like glycosyltransferase
MNRADAFVTCVCAALVLAVVPLRPFWLDEVLQLVGTRPEKSLAEVIAYVPENPGSGPLGYIVQHAFLAALGVNRWSARLPSALFAIATCAATIALARRIGLAHAWLAGAILVALPLMLRYAAEARPYTQATFLAVAATLLVLSLGAGSPRPAALGGYAALLIAGVYTHPFTVLVAGGHILWAAAERRWRLATILAIIAALAASSYIPWIVYARAGWQQTMIDSHFRFAADWKTPLRLFREISGAGYWGSGLLLLLALRGASAVSRPIVALLAGAIGAVLIGGVIADRIAGYFIAVRQFIGALPPFAILAASRPHVCLVAALFAVCSMANWKYFTSATEDWESAAAAVEAELGPSRCLIVEPLREARVYAALRPALSKALCSSPAREFVMAVSPYRDHVPVVLPAGYQIRSERHVGGTRILVLSR